MDGLIFFLLGALFGIVVGTIIEHKQAQQPGHFE